MKSPRIRRILKAKGFKKESKHVYNKNIVCTICNGKKTDWGWISEGYIDSESYNVSTHYGEHDCKRCDGSGIEKISEFILPNI